MPTVFKWDIGILNKLIGMCYKKNQYITIRNLRNLQKLITETDFSFYQTKSVIIKRVEFIKYSLEGKLDKKFADESIIINYAKKDVDEPIINDIVNNIPNYKKLNHPEIKFLNSFIEDRLLYGNIIVNKIKEMSDIIERIETGEYTTYAQAYNWINDWTTQFRVESRKIRTSLNDGVLRLNDPNISERIDDILLKLGTSSSIMITGMQLFNNFFGGGYRSGKLYCHTALPEHFKSGLLLKVCIDAIKYNAKTFLSRKSNHRKAVIYFTMENSMEETFERIYEMLINKDDFFQRDSKYIEASIRECGIIGNDDMELIVVFKPNRSINTTDLRSFLEELDDEGIEVCLLCFDYIKRIRPTERGANEKEELKNVTNELKTIGQDFDIAVVTASQLNREAAAILNAEVRSGNPDPLSKIDASTIGSAWEIMENSDAVTSQALLYNKSEDRYYLSVTLYKCRYYKPKIKYFNQPFSEDKLNLLDDVLLDKPLSLLSLATDFEDVSELPLEGKRGRTVVSRKNGSYKVSTQDNNPFLSDSI